MVTGPMSRILVGTAIFFLLFLSGCGGGGGGVGPASVTVSGTVRAPNGLVAFAPNRGFLDRFAERIFPSAYAVVSGLSPVADGVVVEILRVSDTGQPTSSLATTAVSGGRYTFNLTSHGLSFSPDLIVRVRNSATGKQLRAFVTSDQVAIDPLSEAIVQMVLEKAVGPPAIGLSRFTVQEINDLVTGLDLLTSVRDASSVSDIDGTVAALKSVASSDPNLATFLESASGQGQATDGIGDVGNFFPVGQGNAWRYRGIATPDLGAPTTYVSSVRITGTRAIGDVTAAVFTVVNEDNGGATTDAYYEKNSRGVVSRGTGDLGDPLTPLLVPYMEATFPFRPGASFVQIDRKGVPFPDVDLDGKDETADLASTVTMEGFEEIAVPLGTIGHCAKLSTMAVMVVRLSSVPLTVSVRITETRWFGPGIGLVRRDQVAETAGGGESSVETVREELGGYFADGAGKGILPETVIASGVAPANSDASVPGKAAVATDGESYLVVYRREIGGVGALSATVLSGAGSVVAAFDIPGGGGNPAAAFDGTNYLVVYDRDGLIYGNRVTPSGSILDGQGFPISTGVPFSVTNFLPAVAFGGGNYLVTWGKFGGTEYDVYGSRVSPAGAVLDEFPVFQAAGEQITPSLAFDGANFLVAWRDTRSGSGPSSDTDIWGTMITPGGVVLQPAGIPICAAQGVQGSPSVTFGAGHFLVAWVDGRRDPVDSTFDILAARVEPDGTVLDGPGGIPVDADPLIEGKAYPSVAFDGTNYLVAWQAGSFAIYKPSGIFTVRISPAGTPIGAPPGGGGIVVAEPGDNYTRLYFPSLASRGPNSLMVWSNIGELYGESKSVSGAVVYP